MSGLNPSRRHPSGSARPGPRPLHAASPTGSKRNGKPQPMTASPLLVGPGHQLVEDVGWRRTRRGSRPPAPRAGAGRRRRPGSRWRRRCPPRSGGTSTATSPCPRGRRAGASSRPGGRGRAARTRGRAGRDDRRAGRAAAGGRTGRRRAAVQGQGGGLDRRPDRDVLGGRRRAAAGPGAGVGRPANRSGRRDPGWQWCTPSPRQRGRRPRPERRTGPAPVQFPTESGPGSTTNPGNSGNPGRHFTRPSYFGA